MGRAVRASNWPEERLHTRSGSGPDRCGADDAACESRWNRSCTMCYTGTVARSAHSGVPAMTKVTARAIVSWVPAAKGGRRKPPSGPVYSTVARFVDDPGWPAEAWSLVLRKVRTYA